PPALGVGDAAVRGGHRARGAGTSVLGRVPDRRGRLRRDQRRAGTGRVPGLEEAQGPRDHDRDRAVRGPGRPGPAPPQRRLLRRHLRGALRQAGQRPRRLTGPPAWAAAHDLRAVDHRPRPGQYPGHVTLQLHDTATRTTAPLTPVREGAVSLYVCGPTTQGAPHLGHLRTFVAFDVLVRWLERSGLEVTHVRNVTDIDDKILTRSAEAGAPWWAWSLRFEREFQDVLDRIGNRRPSYEPRATGHITEMVALMQRLIERGHAYADGHGSVYFDVASYPEYGA